MEVASQLAIEPLSIAGLAALRQHPTKAVKDALMTYKSIAQSHHPEAIATLFGKAIALAEEGITKVTGDAKSAVVSGQSMCPVEDLESPWSPEFFHTRLLASASNSSQGKSAVSVTDEPASESMVRIGAFRHSWEVQKAVLELLKNNARFEDAFAVSVKKTFVFCVRWGRRSEFRRLCEFLRSCLFGLLKVAAQPIVIPVNGPAFMTEAAKRQAAMQINLASTDSTSTVQHVIRIDCLSAAIELGCWSEAFRLLEDLQAIFAISKRSLAPQVLATYYGLAAKLFARAGHSLVHAAALAKQLAVLSRNRRSSGKEDSDLAVLVNTLCLALMAIPLGANQAAAASDDRQGRLAQFLGLQDVPDREAMMDDLLHGALSKVSSAAKLADPSLWQLLQRFRSGSVVSEDLQVVKAFIASSPQSSSASLYLQGIQESLSRQALATAIGANKRRKKTVPLAVLLALFPGEDLANGHKQFLFEAWLHRTASQVFGVRVRICHSKGAVTFSPSTWLVPDGSHSLLPTEQSAQQQQLAVSAMAVERDSKALLQQLAAEHEKILQRSAYANTRADRKSQEAERKDLEEQQARALKAARDAETERLRLAEESRKREVERLRREREAIEQAEMRKLADDFRAKCLAAGRNISSSSASSADSSSGSSLLLDPTQFKDKKDFLLKQMLLLDKDKRESEERVMKAARQLDYTERALRQAEIAKLVEEKAAAEAAAANSLQALHQQAEEIAQQLHSVQSGGSVTIAPWQFAISSVRDDMAAWKQSIMVTRQKAWEAVRAEKQALLAEAKAARIAEHEVFLAQEEIRRKQEELERQAAFEASGYDAFGYNSSPSGPFAGSSGPFANSASGPFAGTASAGPFAGSPSGPFAGSSGSPASMPSPFASGSARSAQESSMSSAATSPTSMPSPFASATPFAATASSSATAQSSVAAPIPSIFAANKTSSTPSANALPSPFASAAAAPSQPASMPKPFANNSSSATATPSSAAVASPFSQDASTATTATAAATPSPFAAGPKKYVPPSIRNSQSSGSSSGSAQQPSSSPFASSTGSQQKNMEGSWRK